MLAAHYVVLRSIVPIERNVYIEIGDILAEYGKSIKIYRADVDGFANRLQMELLSVGHRLQLAPVRRRSL